jgi:DNA-binding response OmpR family regulator
VKILIVEDEPKLASALRHGLEDEGYAVEVAGTGEEGFYLMHARPPDLLVLDIMLPNRDGFQILAELRRGAVETPVLLLTARDSVEDRVRGLDHGADDYMVKPFAFPELLARVRALLRRGAPEKPKHLTLAGLEMDVATHTVRRDGMAIDLTAREYDLLEYLLRNQGTVVSRDTLAQEVWKETSRGDHIDNVIDVHMARLRRKIEDGYETKLLHTVRGVGFILREGIS